MPLEVPSDAVAFARVLVKQSERSEAVGVASAGICTAGRMGRVSFVARQGHSLYGGKANGNKWEAHAGATAPGQFCAFDTAQGRAVRNFYTDFTNEVV